jgi:hypothetical protein
VTAPRRTVLAGALSAVLTLALLAVAALPAAAQNTGQVFVGCGFSVGDFRILAVTVGQPNFSCEGYPRYTWNRQGSRGVKGVKGPRGNEGKQGKRGARGTSGSQGTTGVGGASGPRAHVTYPSSATTSGSAGRLLVAEASCRPGDLATGGGFATEGTIISSMSIGGDSPTGWRALALSDEEAETSLTVMAVCTGSTSE